MIKGKAHTRPRGVFNRVLAAYDAGRPLYLRPGDVMYLRHYFAEMGLCTQETFEIVAASGNQKMKGAGR